MYSKMKKYNPASKTFFEYEKDRIQHYSKNKYECQSCGCKYQPKVYSQPYILQFGVVVLSVVAIILIFLKSINIFLITAVISTLYAIYYMKKERRVWLRNGRKPKYGEIILECPNCKSVESQIAV